MNFTKVGSSILVGIFLITVFSNSVNGETYENNEKLLPDWVRHATSLWANDKILDDEYKNMLENLLNQNIISNDFDDYDISYTPSDGIYEAADWYEKKKIKITWEVPQEIKKNSAQTHLKITRPDGKVDKITVYGELAYYEITRKFPLGTYTIDAIYGNTPINIPTFEIVEKLPELRVPVWVKSTAKWWTEEQISDAQFLRSVHYMKNIGLIDFNPNYNSKEIVEEFKVGSLLPTNEEVFYTTKPPVWEIIENSVASKNNLEGVTDSARIILKDITRVYEPVFYKNKIPSMVMEIYEFDNKENLERFWNNESEQYDVFDSSYMTSSQSDSGKCFFDYNDEGAISGCIIDNLIVQVMIFDKSNTHYGYKQTNLNPDENEPTIQFLGLILDKIKQKNDTSFDTSIYQTLQRTSEDVTNVVDSFSKNNFRNIPKTIESESAYVEGIEKFSCNRDDFGIVTIVGEYNNGNTKKDEISLIVSFIDYQGNIIAKSSANLYDLDEYESRKFFGHTKWNGNFYSCNIALN